MIKFSFKIKTLDFSHRGPSTQPLSLLEFDFFPGKTRRNRLSVEEQQKADQYINAGIRQFEKQNYDKAVVEFKHCIAIDSLYLDAYYNLALAYQKSGQNGLACEVWKKLGDMNQKQGEALYQKFCK